ncbi:MAG TPA: MerR family transcriptional regulator [bacterium]|nr:MerR family transcriptional regulator [bacterium]
MLEVSTEVKRYRIGDVANMLDLKPHVLRYWETEFSSFILGEKTEGGQRLYCQQDIDLFEQVKKLLYVEGYSIAGAKKKLSGKDVAADEQDLSENAVPKELLSVIKEELQDIRDHIQRIKADMENKIPRS